MLVKIESFITPRLTLVALLPLAIVLLGRFWWPGETSAWASATRVALLLFLICFLMAGRSACTRLHKGLGTTLLLFAGWIALSVWFMGGQSDILRRGFVLLVFVLAVALLKREGEGRLLALLQVSAIVAAAAALVTIAIKLERIGLDMFRYRAVRLHSSGVPGFAEFFNPIISGMHMAFAGLTAGWCLLVARKPSSRCFWLCCFVIIGLYVFLTYSRSAWLALGLGSLILLVLRGRPMHWGGAAAVLLVALLVVTVGFPEILSIEAERGTTNRDLIWAMVLDSMPGAWLSGHGAGVEMAKMQLPGQTVVNTHSLYLEILFQYGLVGLLLFVSALVLALRRMWGERSELCVLALSLLAGSLGVMFFELHSFIHSPNLIWLWIWFPLGVALGAGATRAEKC